MSYILDALKKSEAERNRSGAPSLLALRQVDLGSRTGMRALLAALIINACLVGFWLFWRSEPAAIVGNQPTATRVLEPATAAPLIAQRAPFTPAEPTTVPDPESVVVDSTSTTKAMEFADLTFSSHIYADDPTMRAVTVNGRRLLEGDTISAGVRLKQITETGVILDVNGRTVPLEVLQDWR